METYDDASSVLSLEKAKKSTLVGKVGNYSVQYNLGAASIAVYYLLSQDDHVIGSQSDGSGEYPEPTWAKYTLLGAVFAGAVLGMLVMGYLGDLLGRRKAMVCTLLLVVLGALGCAVFPWGGAEQIYATIIACRFMVGVGVGGIYPLSAAHSAEQADSTGTKDAQQLREEAASRVGWAFFWQVPGSISPYIVSMVLLLIHHYNHDFSVDWQFRILFGVGAIPASLVIYLTLREKDSEEYVKAQKERKGAVDAFNPWAWAQAHPKWPEMRRALIGTAGCWFIYDVSFYGTAIFTPTILKGIFGSNDSLFNLSWQSIMTTAFGIPGCIFGIVHLRKKGCYWLMFYGFLLMAFSFALLGIVYEIDKDLHAVLFIIFLFVYFSINNGPSVATFVLPALCFPTQARSSFHGVSAAAAKLGAVAGTFMYKPMNEQFGLSVVMAVQATLSLCGALMAYYFIPRTDEVIGGEYTQVPADDDMATVQIQRQCNEEEE